MGFKGRILRVASLFLQQPWARVSRGMTLGARVAVLDDENRVLLVKHTYSPGWILPGGGVESGETLIAAALREIREEAGIVGHDLILHGIFLNDRLFKGDHVACFIMRHFTKLDWKPNHEIADAQFFAIDELPGDTTGGTRRRLAEIMQGAPLSDMW
jgi:8-oxo-dGTP pyrophosphatase MutT (NUDIX family)